MLRRVGDLGKSCSQNSTNLIIFPDPKSRFVGVSLSYWS